ASKDIIVPGSRLTTPRATTRWRLRGARSRTGKSNQPGEPPVRGIVPVRSRKGNTIDTWYENTVCDFPLAWGAAGRRPTTYSNGGPAPSEDRECQLSNRKR